MMKNPLQKAEFLLSVPDPRKLPADTGHEVAFVGRSNAGKSSALNAMVGQKNLARTSKTPGRTQHLVIFSLDEQRRLVDLPGYGYAKVAKSIQNRWVQAMDAYLQSRQSLRGLVLLADVRHPLKDTDTHLMQWATECELPVHVLLTKADKLSRGQGQNQYLKLQKLLKEAHPLASAQLFSAKTGLGLDQARAHVAQWLEIELSEA